MRRISLMVTAALSLGLVACSTGDNTNSTDGTITAVADPAPSSEAPAEENAEGGDDVALNEPFEISSLEDNDVYLNISEISISTECKYGKFSPESNNDSIGEENQYLQILAEVDVQKLDNPQSMGYVYLDDPKIVDSEGFTKSAESSWDCQNGDNYEDWLMPTEKGDKTRRYGAWIIPSGTTEVRLYDKTYTVQ